MEEFCSFTRGNGFFPNEKRGDQSFSMHAKGVPEKKDDRPSQIDCPPHLLKIIAP